MPHGVELNGEELFFAHVHLHGAPAPVRRYLPELIDLVWSGKINPGKVFDLTLPLDQVAEGYAQWMNAARSRRCCGRNSRIAAHGRHSNGLAEARKVCLLYKGMIPSFACQQRTNEINDFRRPLEATPGIEPGYADLQSDASPLRHVALDSCGIMIIGT